MLTAVAGLLMIAAAVVAIARGADVRLALLVAAFGMGGLAGDVMPVVRIFFATFGSFPA